MCIRDSLIIIAIFQLLVFQVDSNVEDVGGGFGEWLLRIFTEQIGIYIGGVIAGILTYFTRKFWLENKFLKSLIFGISNDQRNQRNVIEPSSVNVLLIGRGGTGKTSIIRALTGCRDAIPKRTNGIRAYSFTQFIDYSKKQQDGASKNIRRSTEFYFLDYQGQRPEFPREYRSLLEEREKKVTSNVIVFVVDLFSPPTKGKERIRPDKKSNPDESRVKLLNRSVEHDFISSVKGLSEHPVKDVILFINKIDMLNSQSEAKLKAVVKEYKFAINELNIVFNNDKDPNAVEPKIILGSASEGWGISGWAQYHGRVDELKEYTLMERLIANAQRIG